MSHARTILINDVDAAGVVFYARAMAIAHEAYELVMAELGLSFAEILREGRIALPVVHAEADFHRPLRHGDQVQSLVRLRSRGETSYRIAIDLMLGPQAAVSVTQVHVHLDRATRTASALSPAVLSALQRLEPYPAAAGV